MKITEIKVFPVDEEKLKAFVSIVIEDCFMVNDIKVIRGREGLFISMPSRRKKNGKFKDVAHPLNNDTRQTLETMILDEYDRTVGESGGGLGEQESDAAPVKLVAKSEEREAVWEASDNDAGSELENVTRTHLRDSFWTS